MSSYEALPIAPSKIHSSAPDVEFLRSRHHQQTKFLEKPFKTLNFTQNLYMRTVLYTLVLIGLTSAAACGKKFKAGSLPKEQIVFGTGGGMAGIERRFILLPNGQLFEQRGFETPKELPGIDKKTAKALWQQAQTIGMPREGAAQLGNTYQFFEMPAGEQPARAAWSPQQEDISPDLKQYYELLMHTVSTLPQN
jgi:hypothetical protein